MPKKIIKAWPDLNEARSRLPQDRKPIYINSFSYPVLLELLSGKKFFIETHGCQANVRDEETIKGILSQFGMIEADSPLTSNLMIINTCAVRENAENKVFGELGELKAHKKDNSDFLIALCGCMVQQPEILEKLLKSYPQIDFVFGTDNISDLPSILTDVLNQNRRVIDVASGAGRVIENLPVKRNSSTQAFVNIMYGCDKFCTYCIVPYTRGRQRSRLPEDILKEVSELKDRGYIEITLLGQNVNAYGKDLEECLSFSELLDKVAATGVLKVKFLTSHPWDFSDELIEVIKNNPNIARTIHLPIQSGSNQVLKEMGRRYTYEDYKSIYTAIKKAIPEMTFSTDIIVGYPTERRKEFEDTLKAVKELEFGQYFTFIYSPRKGTPAAKLEPCETQETYGAWFKELTDICYERIAEQNARTVGKVLSVIVTGISRKDEAMLTCRTDDNVIVHVRGDKSLINKVMNVKITSAMTFAMFGEIFND